MKLINITGTRNIYGGIDNLESEIIWETEQTNIADALGEYDYIIPNTDVLPDETYKEYAIRMFLSNDEKPGDMVSYLVLEDENDNMVEEMRYCDVER